jgi:peroxiredoxin
MRFASPKLSLLLGAVLTSAAAQTPLPAAPAVGVPRPAPDFALKSLSGENLRLSEYLGQVVLLNFWATWAGPCRRQMPELDRLHQTYRSAGLVVLGVNVDEDQARAASFARTLGVSYPVLFDARKQVAPAYDLKTLPTTVLIDRAGRVRFVQRDYEPGGEQDYVAQLRALLDE